MQIYKSVKHKQEINLGNCITFVKEKYNVFIRDIQACFSSIHK